MGGVVAASRRETAQSWLHNKQWDQIFILGGALLVPIPIIAFFALQSLGYSRGICEDLVTILVMVTVGGPHVFATYTRTFFNPRFRREDPGLFAGAFGVLAVVIGALIASAFFDARVLGRPPMQLVMTFFFFWAGIHIIQQNSYCLACYSKLDKTTAVARRRRLWNALDYLVMLGCLYPVAFFRMSMGNPADPTGLTANPDALTTSIVLGLTGSTEFADGYVFRIGKVVPVLPEFAMTSAFWMLITGLFLLVLVLFVFKSVREWSDGTIRWPRFLLVSTTAVVGIGVALMPNLDSSFQGFNAWHSFQYLGLVWLMNRRSYDAGETDSRFVGSISKPGRHWRYYLVALGATLAVIGLVVVLALLIQYFSGGKFLLLGYPEGAAPVEEGTGRTLYRPGSILMAYYMCGFSLLLIHYLHDGFFFFRTRYLVGKPD